MPRLIRCLCHKDTFSAPFSDRKPITKTTLLQARIFTTEARGRWPRRRARITHPSMNFPLCTDRRGYGRTRLGSLGVKIDHRRREGALSRPGRGDLQFLTCVSLAFGLGYRSPKFVESRVIRLDLCHAIQLLASQRALVAFSVGEPEMKVV